MDEISYGTIWVCQCCLFMHANGECCADDDHGGDGCEPLSEITGGFSVSLGMGRENHECDDPDDDCDCETNTFSTSQCEGCGSWLHGERHAMTLFGPASD